MSLGSKGKTVYSWIKPIKVRRDKKDIFGQSWSNT